MFKKLLPLVISLSLTACGSLGPNYQRPPLDTETKLTVKSNIPTATTNGLAWWHSFQDPVLNDLLEEALANNQQIKLAVARVEEARGTLAVTASDNAPSVDAVINASKNRYSENSSQSFPNSAGVSRNLQAGLSASYQIDLWGKLRRAGEADHARLLSQQANRDTVLITLSTDVAQNYFALRAADQRMELINATVKTRQDSLALQQKRFAAGIISQAQLHQAEIELSTTEIAAEQLKQSRSMIESALAVLVGRTPSAIAHPVIVRGKTIAQLQQHLTVPAELSSDLLNRRPDLIAAEQNLIAVNADIGQAKTLFFPAIRLTAGTGYESQALKTLIDPASLLWNIGASLAQPIYHRGSMKGIMKIAYARKDQALALYIQAVQNAFRDTHDALTQISAAEKITAAQQRQFSAAQDNARLAELRYNSGYSSLVESLDAQRDLFQIQSYLIDAQYAQLTSVINLYKAVGGSWGK